MRLCKNRGGFTLVELVVGMLVSSIILLFAGSMMFSANGFFLNTANRNEAKQLGDTIFSYIKEELIYATDMQLFADQADAAGNVIGDRSITVRDGKLYAMDSQVFGDDFYHGRTIKLTASVHIMCELDLSVSVLDGGGTELYKTSSTINILNMQLKQQEIIAFSGVGDNPYITYNEQGEKP